MKKKSNIKLNLTNEERAALRKHKVKIAEILDYAVDEIEAMLPVSAKRARELYALADFQQIPSVGIKFAEDLVFMGYYAVSELKGLDAATLTDQYEKKKDYWIDSCVEDQFRLAVHFANTGDPTKNWWDFTSERKAFRAASGYPADRPKTSWYEVLKA
jgi:hypothetical protein